MIPVSIDQIIVILNSSSTFSEKLNEICHLLQHTVPHYDWVGFYFHLDDRSMLQLGPYAGEPTEHTLIPFGKGICGQVALNNKTFLVEDVHAQDNYISCSIHVKSEIVVPLFVNGKNIGQIDIDSHTPHAFTNLDQEFLELVNARIGAYMEKHSVEKVSSFL